MVKKFSGNYDDTCAWLDKVGVNDYSLAQNEQDPGKWVVDVDGDVVLLGSALTHIRVKFGKVNGSFICENNKLISLKNAPDWVGDVFSCEDNLLSDLLHGPSYVGGEYWCNNNRISSLIGSPKHCKDFICNNNRLTSLEHICQNITGNLDFSVNEVDNFVYFPSHIGGSIDCLDNPVSLNRERAGYLSFKEALLWREEHLIEWQKSNFEQLVPGAHLPLPNQKFKI